MKKRLCVIGGVQAGLGAATQARRNDPDLEILVFEKTPFISYGLCGLPFFISDVIKKAEDLMLYSSSYFKNNRNIDVLTEHLVQKIDVNKKELVVMDLGGRGQEKKYHYDELILATGARAVQPLDMEGIHLRNIFTLRDLGSALELKQTISREKPKNAVVIGSGLIGLSMAESFSSRGIRTTVIENQDQILIQFSRRMAEMVKEELARHKVEVLTHAVLEGFLGRERVEKVCVDGKTLPADIVLLSMGVVPEIEPGCSAGIELEPVTGALRTNKKMACSVPHIYAAGDCTHSYSSITGRPVYMPLATITDKQAQIAAHNATARSMIYQGTIGTMIEKVFGLMVARTGLTERQLGEAGIEFVTREAQGYSRAHYYPNTKKMFLKLFVETGSKRIMGAEMIGEEGVDKRIDLLGLAIYNKMRLADLYHLDLSYTPPFSASRDILWQISMK